MLNLYRYMVQNGMKKIEDVPQPYQDMLRSEMAPAPEPVEATTEPTV
jgi:spore coat protein CotF